MLKCLEVAIEATKDGVKFSCSGDIGNGAVTLRSHTNVDKPDLNVEIALSEPVALTFSLKYLVNFCKASGLSGTVKLCLSSEVPLLVEYGLASNSYLRFYLAPKVKTNLSVSLPMLADPVLRLATRNEDMSGTENNTTALAWARSLQPHDYKEWSWTKKDMMEEGKIVQRLLLHPGLDRGRCVAGSEHRTTDLWPQRDANSRYLLNPCKALAYPYCPNLVHHSIGPQIIEY